MTSRLEERYRGLLRILPSGYRAVWEEEMVGAFLDSVATGDPETDEYRADFGRPGWSEVASVVTLAIRLRTGAAGTTPRYLAWGQAVRLVALVGLLVQAAWGLVIIGLGLWLAGRLTLLPAPPPAWTQGPPVDLWHRVTDAAWLAWLLAYIAVLLGHVRAARWVAVLAMVPAVLSMLWHVFALGAGPNTFTEWYLMLLKGLVVLALTAWIPTRDQRGAPLLWIPMRDQRDTPPVRPRPWLLGLPVATVLVLGVVLLPAPAPDSPPLLDLAGLYSLAFLGAAGWYAWRGRHRTDWAHALALLALAVFGLRLGSILDYATGVPFTDRTALIGLGLIEAAAVVAAGVPLAVRTVRALRRLPTMAETSVPDPSSPASAVSGR